MLQRMIKETGMTQESVVNQEPLGRLGMPSEIAESVVWLLSTKHHLSRELPYRLTVVTQRFKRTI